MYEQLLGIILNRLSRKYTGGQKDCAVHMAFGDQPRSSPFWTKVHGSGRGGFVKLDTMAMAQFLRFADGADMDGRINSEKQLYGEIISRPFQFEQAFQTLCM